MSTPDQTVPFALDADICSILARVAAGDRAGIVALLDRSGERLFEVLRAHLAALGCPGDDDHEVRALVVRVGVALADRAQRCGPRAAAPGWVSPVLDEEVRRAVAEHLRGDRWLQGAEGSATLAR